MVSRPEKVFYRFKPAGCPPLQFGQILFQRYLLIEQGFFFSNVLGLGYGACEVGIEQTIQLGFDLRELFGELLLVLGSRGQRMTIDKIF